MAEPAASNQNFKDLRLRVITGGLVALLTFVLLMQGGLIFTFFIAVCSIIMLHEWRGLTQRGNAAFQLVGIPYILLPCLSLAGLRLIYFDEDPMSIWPALFVICVVAATDIGAYVSGRLIGGPRLWPAVSPKKTWAGTLGGMASGIVVSVAFIEHVQVPGTMVSAFALGMALSVVSQLGDLFESWLKRRAGVKDSGRLLPGHGGLLDRVDGLLFAAPLYFVICLMGGGRLL